MKRFFSTSRGEFFATATLLALIAAAFAFYFLYDKHREPVVNVKDFRQEVEEFYASQQAAADSVQAARDSAYASRRHTRDRAYPHYSRGHANYPQYGRDSTGYRQSQRHDPLKPLPREQGYAIVKVDLNRCDTGDITRVPTFGSKRALKIVEYRDRLGGFHSLAQLREIYILQNIDLTLCEKYFTVSAAAIRRIHVNRSSYKELVAHPYIDAYLAKTITNYVSKNGKINDIGEFQSITHAYTELIDKLKPYLSFD